MNGGSCHLFRHSTATLKLDADAGVRHIAEIPVRQEIETTMGFTIVSMAKFHEVQGCCHTA